MKKRLLSMILALSMMLTILPVNAITAWAADGKSGACGGGLTYTMIQNDGTDTYTLAITKSGTGTGVMTDYGYGSTPWYADCGKITKLTIDGATSIGKNAFDGCRNLTDVVISSGVTSIGEDAFEFCEKLTNTSISNILKEATSIGEGAFRGCTSLTSVEIPESVTSIDVAAFGQCSNLTSVKILGTITSIAKSTFIVCGKLRDIEIPVSVTSIGDWAFQGCSELADIKIPEKVTSIGNCAFKNCTSLTTIKIPDSVTSIGESAFNGCSSLHHVDLPYVIPTISQAAFDNVNTHYYYPGYRGDFVSQAQKKIATGIIGMESPTYSLVHCYSDVSFDANGGSFADGGTQKKVEKIWSATKLTQEQVDSIGMPKRAGKIFLGWNTTSNATTTINPISDYVVDGKIYYAVYRDVVPATIAINDSNKTFKAGTESNAFTVTATKGDTEAAKVKFKFTNGTVQYKNNSTDWTDLTGNEISIDELNSALFRIATNKNATVGTSTLTVELVTDQGTEIGVQNTADFTVTARTPAAVTITGPTNNAVKAGEPSQTFTMSITNHDDAVGKVTFDFDGEVQYADNTYSPNWTTVDKDNGVTRAIATGKYFRVVPKADAATGDMTLTAKLVDTDGNEIAGATASTAFAVTARKPAEVTIDGLDGTTVKAGKAKEFTVNVTPNDDTIDKVTFGTTSGEVQWSNDGGNTWTTVPSDVNLSDLTGKKFRVVPAADAANGTVIVTVTAKKADGTEVAKKDASFTVTAREHAKVTIDGLGTDLKQGESKDFTVKVDPKDDSGDATIDFGDKNSEIQYKDGEDWKSMPSDGLKIDLNNGKKPYDFRITPKNDGENQKLTATVKKENTKLGEAEKSYNVSKYVDAVVKIDGLSGTVETDTEKEFTVTVTANDDAGKNVTAKAGFTGPAGATITLKKVQYRFGDSGEWQDGMQELNGMNLDINSLELPFNSLPNITYKLTVTFAEAGNYEFDVSLTKAAAAEAFTSDSAEVTVTKKKEPVTPGGGSTGGGENPGENPGGGSTGDSGNTKPTPKPDEKPDRKIKIDGGIVEVNGKEVKPDEDGNITVKKGDEITITVDKSKISDAQVFDQWVIKPDSVLNEVDPKSEKISFTMPAEDVTIEAMTRDASIEDDGPGILGTGALIATGVVGSAALLYQGHMLGTELYLRYLLPHGAVIPQNRAELAVLLWQDAESPEPVSTTLYSDISDEDSAIQQAARWAVENDLMEQLDAEEHPDHFDPFVPVTFSDSIRAWKKAQELKKSVH